MKNVKGFVVFGMFMGLLGMEYGDKKDSYVVYVFNEYG